MFQCNKITLDVSSQLFDQDHLTCTNIGRSNVFTFNIDVIREL